MAKFTLGLVPMVGVMVFWNAPAIDSWQFWAGAVCLGVYGVINAIPE